MTEQIDRLIELASKAATEKRFAEAESHLECLLKLEPNHVRALDLFGFVRFFQGRFAEAERYCRRTLDVSSDHAYAHKGLGLCLAKQGQLDEGILELEKAIALKPAWTDPYWDLAVVLVEGERHREALDALERGIKAAPEKREQFRALAERLRNHLGADP